MNAKQIKAVTGAATKWAGISMLVAKFECQTWTRNGRDYCVSGYDARKDLLHFTATWSLEGGGVGHSRVAIPLAQAVDDHTGDLSSAAVLF